jgi:ABC-type sugar transport system permease subunit
MTTGSLAGRRTEENRGQSANHSERRGEFPDWIVAALMLAPAMTLILVLQGAPIAASFWTSLQRADLAARSGEFIGLRNYAAALGDPLFGESLGNTLYFALLVIAGSTIVGLGMALILNEPFRGRSVVRVIMMLPWSLSQVVVGLTFGWILNSQFGPLNAILLRLGVIDQGIAWFRDGFVALTILGIVFAWNILPYAGLLFLGSLQTIPAELYQAARMDGAGAWSRFRAITIPSIRPTILIVLVIATLNGFIAFTLVYLLTGGGPGTATTLFSWWGFETTFRDLDLGRGAAIFYMLGMVILVITIVYMRLLFRRADVEW